jgi:hypothetical protein
MFTYAHNLSSVIASSMLKSSHNLANVTSLLCNTSVKTFTSPPCRLLAIVVKMMHPQIVMGWLSKNFALQGLVFFQGRSHNAVGRTFCDAIKDGFYELA